MDKNSCDHAEEIGKAMYDTHYAYINRWTSPVRSVTHWNDLTNNERGAWKNLAKRSLKIIGEHAAEDIKEYAKAQFKQSSGWMKLLWGAIGGAALVGGAFLNNSCSTVDHMILQGEKGTLNYYVDPSSGDSVLIVSPAKVQPKK